MTVDERGRRRPGCCRGRRAWRWRRGPARAATAGGLEVAVGGLEGLLRIHHPGAGGLAQGLDVLGGERHRRSSIPGSLARVGWRAGSAALGVPARRSDCSLGVAALGVAAGAGASLAGRAHARLRSRRRAVTASGASAGASVGLGGGLAGVRAAGLAVRGRRRARRGSVAAAASAGLGDRLGQLVVVGAGGLGGLEAALASGLGRRGLAAGRGLLGVELGLLLGGARDRRRRRARAWRR